MLQKSSAYQDMLIIITYDENGGQWDHVRAAAARQVGTGHADSADCRRPDGEAWLCRSHAVRFRLHPADDRAALWRSSR